MKSSIKSVVVVGNSDSFGIEVGQDFKSVSDCVDAFLKMKSPHPDSWPCIMNRIGLPTKNYSTPASGFFSNFSKVISLSEAYKDSLFLIDISLFDHLCDENLNYRPRNTSLFHEGAIEKVVFQFSVQQQIFFLNEFKKILKNLKLIFKFISLGNVFFDYSLLSKSPERELYAEQIRKEAFNSYPSLPTALKEYFLFDFPYSHLLPSSSISKYCHINSLKDNELLAKVIVNKILSDFSIENFATEEKLQ